ncbi:hypothetical protein BGX20_004361 [Mortierella sp. AD010]|nr:hypothetical protein BGX20_004361 [Mortierella sp. AD010]
MNSYSSQKKYASLPKVTALRQKRNAKSSLKPSLLNAPSHVKLSGATSRSTRKNGMAKTATSRTEGLHSTRATEGAQPLSEANVRSMLKEQQQQQQRENQVDQPYAASNSSQLDPLDIEDAIESTVLKNASLPTKALYELAEDMAEAAADVVILGKRKVEEEEEEESGATYSTSSRNGASARVLKRTRLATSNEKADALDAGCRFIKESRLLAEVRNETLRLKTMAQFVLLRSMLVMNNQAASAFNTANKISPPASSFKPLRRSSRIASKHIKKI